MEGWHVDLILRHWDGEIIYGVDPYDTGGIENNPYPARKHVWDHRKKKARDMFSSHFPRAELWETDSQTAVFMIDDGTLDWVYLDGRHDYDGVREDIEIWLPKIKKGGIIAGHDYAHHPDIKQWPGVKKAVNEFFGDCVNTMDTGLITSWYVLL